MTNTALNEPTETADNANVNLGADETVNAAGNEAAVMSVAEGGGVYMTTLARSRSQQLRRNQRRFLYRLIPFSMCIISLIGGLVSDEARQHWSGQYCPVFVAN